MTTFNFCVLALSIFAALLHSSPAAASVSASEFQSLDCVIQPSKIIDVGVPVPGIIKGIYFDRSDVISQGDTLFQLDTRLEEVDVSLNEKLAQTVTAIELRKSILALGQKTKKRNDQLLGDSLIPAQEIDKLDNDIKIAGLRLELERQNKVIAEINYERAVASMDQKTVKSKIDGIVVERYKAIGERVHDSPVLRIAQLDPLYIEAVVPSTILNSIRHNMKALVTPSMPGSKRHTATVVVIDKIMDPASSTFGIRLELPNPNHDIPAGVLCQLELLET